MKKLLNIILSLLLLFLIGAIYWSFGNKDIKDAEVDFFQTRQAATAYVEKTNLWEALFRDLVEHLYILFPDGTLYHATSYESNQVALDVYQLLEILQNDNHSISDAVLVIHNHIVGPIFSHNDTQFYHILVNRGFKGHFLLYVMPLGKTRELGR